MNRTVLIVDDNPIQTIMLKRTLMIAGLKVIAAKNGLEALDFLRNQSIDLIISDVNMPKMNGYEFCQTVKNDTNLSHIPLILCTVLSHPKDLIKGIEVGANNYITRPWNDANLINLVNELLVSPPRFPYSEEDAEEIILNGEIYKIRTNRQYILNFLLSTYQNIQKQNQELNHLRDELQKAYSQLASTQKEQEQILFNIFPEIVAQELIAYGSAIPRRYEEATVMFIDFVGFAKSTMSLNAQDLIEALEFYFATFDEIIDKHHLERIKTIGDGYMCVGGIPTSNSTHAIDCSLAALEIQKFVKEAALEVQNRYHISWKARIGIHTGSLIAGVIGKKRLAYDVWGETVNLANRMETYSAPNKINISSSTYKKIKSFFICQPRGESIAIKNKEGVEELSMKMYFIEGINSKNPPKPTHYSP